MDPIHDVKTFNPTTLHEANNVIRFLQTSHKEEVSKWKDAYQKQVENLKRLEATRKRELEFLTAELRKYEINLTSQTESITKKLAEKDEWIRKQAEIIEDLNVKLTSQSTESLIPEIRILGANSNSDSGIALENDDKESSTQIIAHPKSEMKNFKKCSTRFADSINFLKRVDFSSRKHKVVSEAYFKPDVVLESKRDKLAVPVLYKNPSNRRTSRALEVERPNSAEPILRECSSEVFLSKPKTLNDSMANHFTDDSEDSEDIFDRVMTRSSVRRSVKANPKYKKINRAKSKLLEQIKLNILD
ncbi:hypothetical protein EVAR_2243_1 [Eumeta japonica]|uniref:Uncharacterized protein n=1 Tax=Eumeta variegata TaxID=151549 RepID=A0A4C1SFM6_EUMVA|nr:hypothetical protein EVAR_2243_1 [Eumeta japonica]